MPDQPDMSSKAAKTNTEESKAAAPEAAAPALTSMVTRARWLMLISALTTALAIAAVLGVIGYRLFGGGERNVATIANGTVFLPKGAHVDSTTVADGRMVVTFDIGGASEVRIFDLKTLQLIGEVHFATER